jgi:hypothetical protein
VSEHKGGEVHREVDDPAQQSTEQALSLTDSDRQLTDEEREARENARQVFWRSVGRRRRRLWK